MQEDIQIGKHQGDLQRFRGMLALWAYVYRHGP